MESYLLFNINTCMKRIKKQQTCLICKTIFLTASFNPKQFICSICNNIRIKERLKKCNKIWRANNKELIKQKEKQHNILNKEKIVEYNKNYYLLHNTQIKQTTKQWYKNNRVKMININKEYAKTYIHPNPIENLKHRKEYNKQYIVKNKEKLYQKNKLYCIKNKQKIREKYKNRLKTDIEFRLLEVCRRRLNSALKRKKSIRSNRTINLIGCSLNVLKSHIESKFQPNMNWLNHGYGIDKWHIDHIIPCSSFDLTKEEEQQKCFHYTNLQPLWQIDNLLKGDKIIT